MNVTASSRALHRRRQIFTGELHRIPAGPDARQHPWAELLRRVFLVDVLDCPRCQGRMRIVGAVTEPGAVERILKHLGASPAAPRIAGPRAPPGDEETGRREFDLRNPNGDDSASC